MHGYGELALDRIVGRLPEGLAALEGFLAALQRRPSRG